MVKIINKKFIILIFIFSHILFFSCKSEKDKVPPQIENGILDLSSWNLKQDGKIELKGKAEFYWMKALGPDDFKGDKKPPMDGYVAIPGRWNSFKINGKEIGSKGYGTIRFIVKCDTSNEKLALKLHEISTAYNLFIEGKKVSSVGVFSTDIKVGQPGRFPHVKVFSPENKEFEILFQVSNFHSIIGGCWYKIYLGNSTDIMIYKELTQSTDIFVFGCLFIMFVYYLGFFILRKKEKASLFFSMGCLFLGIYTLFTGEILVYNVFPSMPWLLLVHMMFIMSYLSMSSLTYFFYYLFPKETNKRIVDITGVLCVTASVISVFSSHDVIVLIMYIFSGIMVLWALYISIVLVKAIRKKRQGSVIYVFGCVLLLSTIVNDVLFGLGVIHTAFMAPFGLLAFIFAQGMLLSNRFYTAFTTVEILSKDLEQKNIELNDLNLNLEMKVVDRTEELQAAMEELEAINDVIKQTNDDLIEAHIIAEKDMKLATYVQSRLLPNEPPRLKEWDIAFEFKPMTDISGDLFDFYIKSGKMQGMNICDVSGHGVASGLITMIARSVFFRNFEKSYDMKLGRIMEQINSDMISEIDSIDHYLTSILLRFNGSTAEYVNAGHTDLLVRKCSTGKVKIVKPNDNDKDVKGMFIGVKSLERPYDSLRFKIDPGDIILLYSDCIIESKNLQGEMFEDHRLITSFENAGGDSAQEIIGSILDDLYNFIQVKDLLDDLTVIALKYLG